MELREPRRKRRVRVKSRQPFPVPIRSLAEDGIFNDIWRTYIGQYTGKNVVVTDHENMTALHGMGFFGKGSLSRSAPTFGKWKMDAPPLVYNRQWKRRCEWTKLHNNARDENVERKKETSETKSVSRRVKRETEEEDDLVFDQVVKSDSIILGKECHQISKNRSKPNIDGCELDSKQGQTVIVLGDSDCDSADEDYLLSLNPRLEQEEFPLQETLLLTLEEAFFLSYALGCLQVHDLTGNELSLLELWKLFCRSQTDFIEKYVVYHYFRSKGWVVKPGIKFGGDFLLYKQGPAFFHASYIVYVHAVSAGGNFLDNTTLSWTQYMGLNRLAETAGKEVLLCNVVWPDNINRSKPVNSPKILQKFTVHEVLLRRWVSSQEREEQNEEDDINGDDDDDME